jgi:ADP-ribosylglycohydrolase
MVESSLGGGARKRSIRLATRMLPPKSDVRRRLADVLRDKTEQGHVTEGLEQELAALPDSYDAFAAFAEKLARLPMRDDFPYVEPSDWPGIVRELSPSRVLQPIRPISREEASRRVESAFLSSVCGCILGKPVEVNPSLAEMKGALTACGEWPLDDYITDKLSLRNNRSFHQSYVETCRERIAYAAADDDINYTVLGMLILEKHGAAFTHDQMRQLWLKNIPSYWSWGPERNFVGTATVSTLNEEWKPRGEPLFEHIADVLNPGEELCGAMIRADAYGYACPANPAFAAWLAYKDASLTHRKNGIYGSMFAAAAMAAASVARSPLEMFEVALGHIPQRSRFYRIVSDALDEVSRAGDWLDGYARIHGKYKEYTHCRVFQESGTLINTLRFAEGIGDGICKQVMQGNDTDSYGATSGSLLGLYFGPGRLEERWLRPFHDVLHTTLADFHEQKLSAVAARMGELVALGATASPPG